MENTLTEALEGDRHQRCQLVQPGTRQSVVEKNDSESVTVVSDRPPCERVSQFIVLLVTFSVLLV